MDSYKFIVQLMTIIWFIIQLVNFGNFQKSKGMEQWNLGPFLEEIGRLPPPGVVNLKCSKHGRISRNLQIYGGFL